MPLLRSALALALLAAAPAGDPEPSAARVTDPHAAWDAAMADFTALQQGEHEAAPRCAASFLALAIELPPDHPRAAAALFHAAQCHDAAGQWGDAAALYLRLLTRAPDDEHARVALEALARGHQAVARYAEAADFAEQYAARYPRDAQTPDLLRDAYLMRVGLGQRDRALAVLDRLEALYLRRDPEQAARIFWRRGDLLRDERELHDHAMAYLKRHGKSGPLDLRIVASARIGELQWRAACDKGLLLDLCVSERRGPPAIAADGPRDRARLLRETTRRPARAAPPAPRTCMQPTTPALKLYPRDPKRAAEARRWLEEATQLARRGRVQLPADDLLRLQAYRHAAATAALHLADAQFEELLALDVPAGLDFTHKQQRVREDSLRRLAEHLATTHALAQALEQRYSQLAAERASPDATITALYRLGQLAEYRAAALLHAELPRDLREPPLAATYCAALHDHTDPLIATATAAYTACLDRSITTGEFTDASRLCAANLTALDPRTWPATAELFGAAGYTTSRPQSLGLVEQAPPLTDAATPD